MLGGSALQYHFLSLNTEYFLSFSCYDFLWLSHSEIASITQRNHDITGCFVYQLVSMCLTLLDLQLSKVAFNNQILLQSEEVVLLGITLPVHQF